MFSRYKKDIFLSITSFLIFFILAAFITFPLLLNLNSIATGLGDELVIAWIQNWVLHAFGTNLFHLFEANTYFPYHNVLAYSDMHLTSSLLGFPISLLFAEPIAVYNFTQISSLIFLGFSLYILCYYLTKDFFASILSGILVIFSPAVLSNLVHVQILSIAWVPLSILFFLYFLKSHKSKFLVLSLICFILQTYNSFLPGYFIIFSYFIILSFEWFHKRQKIKKIISKKNLLIFIFAFLLIIPIIIPYYQISKEFNYQRDIRDSIHFALQPEDLLYSSQHSKLYPILNNLTFNKQSQNSEFKPAYLGFTFTLLAISIIVYLITRFKKKNTITNSFFVIGLTGLILSFGPFLHLGRQTIHYPFPVPLPYAVLYYILPGFNGFRNSARWEMFFILAFAVLIGLVISRLLKNFSSKKKVTIYLLLFIGIISEFNFPMKFFNVPQKKDFPKVYSWLNTLPKDSSIIIMPIYNWNMEGAEEEMKREYYSTTNFIRTVNGYSGFSPPPWQELIIYLSYNFSSEQSISKIKNLNVDYIVIDRRMYDKGFKEGNEKVNAEYVINSLKKNSTIKYIKEIDGYYLFKFLSKKVK